MKLKMSWIIPGFFSGHGLRMRAGMVLVQSKLSSEIAELLSSLSDPAAITWFQCTRISSLVCSTCMI